MSALSLTGYEPMNVNLCQDIFPLIATYLSVGCYAEFDNLHLGVGVGAMGTVRKLEAWRPANGEVLSLLVILSMENTMVALVISEHKTISRLMMFQETGPWHCDK